MGRRKIEIKAIKDDRNRSVTFLKRKGGLFKKAHELSVLCSVDVAVFIFGSNKKLYEYSSCDMRDLITRYTYHGGPNEHKGPSDFNGGNDDDDDDDENGTPPLQEPMDTQMMPPHFQGQPQFPQIRHHTPSASPPINGVPFQPHPGHPIQRGHTPQPQITSRPGSRNDIRRMGGPNMPAQQVGQHQPSGPQPVNGYAFMPNPAIYNPQNPPNMGPNMSHPQGVPVHSGGFPYPQAQPHPHPQMQPYMEDQRRASLPPNYPTQAPPQGPPVTRPEPSPQPHAQQLPPQPGPQPLPHMSPPPPQHQHMDHPPQPQIQEPQPPAPLEPRPETHARPQPPLLNTDTAIKKLPQRKQHSIFTPIDENRSILSQHLASFANEPERIKNEALVSRSHSVDVGAVSRNNGITSSPPLPPQRANTQTLAKPRHVSVSGIPETTFTPPSRSNSLKVGGVALGRPRLKVQIPDGGSDNGSATGDSNSPRNSTDATSQTTRRHASDSHSSSMVLPPPSPSASALLSAGATGPPNPFARPPPHQSNSNMIDTPVSALPSRFLNNEFLPSPSSFFPDWNPRDSNTLPSPLNGFNFTTPVVGTGPSFLRDDATIPGIGKRKSPEANAHGPGDNHDLAHEPKRVKVE